MKIKILIRFLLKVSGFSLSNKENTKNKLSLFDSSLMTVSVSEKFSRIRCLGLEFPGDFRNQIYW